MGQQLPLFDPPWWAVRPPGYDAGPCDHHCIQAFTETEARQKFGREVEVCMLEGEWEELCNSRYGDKWPVVKATRGKDE